MTDSTDSPAATSAGSGGPRVGRMLTLLFAAACGVLVANLYYAQPLIALIGHSTGMPAAAESSLVTVTQLGYAAGLVLLVPLGDIFENRRLIMATMALNVVSLAGLALIPGLWPLFAMMFVVGATSCAAQMIVPLAASLTAPRRRGAVVGNIMSGLLTGIVLARPLSSFLAGYVGWRGVFGLSAAAVAAVLIGGAAIFPRRRPAADHSYGELLRSLWRLFVEMPVLRRRSLYHAAMFGAFSLFWTGAPSVLLRPPFNFSTTQVALFTLAGVLGVFAAPIAGRLADRGHVRQGTIAAMSLVIVSFAIAALGRVRFWPLLVTGIVMDLGVQANVVFGQREIYQLDERIRNRLNAVYMTTFFLGGALGSALTSPLLESVGWYGVCALGAAMPAVALAYFLLVEGR